MDLISPVAACPHCGLPLDDATTMPVAIPAPPPEPEEAAEPVAAPPEPPAAVAGAADPTPAGAAPAWVPSWAAFIADQACAEPPAPAADSQPLVAEFAPVYTRPHPDPAPPRWEAPAVEEEPWITVPATAPAVASVDEDAATAAGVGPSAAEESSPPTPGVVVDTGRGWGIRDAGADVPAAPLAAHVERLATAAPAPAGSRTRSVRIAIIGVTTALLGAVTYAGVAGGALPRLFGGSHVAAPASIGSLTRVNGAQTETLLAAVQSKVHASSDTEAVAAVYGTGATPKLVFVAYAGAAVQTPDQLVATVNASGTPFTAAPTVSTVGGQQYVCGRVGAKQAPSVICTWADSHAAGFVYTIDNADIGGTLRLADVARVSSEAGR